MRKFLLIYISLLFATTAIAQPGTGKGILGGNVMDESKKALTGATVELFLLKDSTQKQSAVTTNTGEFSITGVSNGIYRLRITYVGMQSLQIDSISFRDERNDFNLADLTMKPKASGNLDEVIVYSEKPLIQSKDGNITFNASESALAAGSTASELLNNVPLVTKDPNGKIQVRGKEPKILIDDKPVELNLQQLQDLLESMPGSSIEKIEVMTNPPPQYANEQGGVINIVTRKGKVGKSGRMNMSGSTRGDRAISGNFSYRKKGLVLSVNGGLGFSQVKGSGYSFRDNLYADSVNHFNTVSDSRNQSLRPNFNSNLDYDLTKYQSLNFSVQYSQGHSNNRNNTEYINLNRFDSIYRLSERHIQSTGNSYNPNFSFSYTLRTKRPGEMLRVIQSAAFSSGNSTRDFYQQYFNNDHTPNGVDSTQRQVNTNKNQTYSTRINYDLPFADKKTFLSVGGYYTGNTSHVVVDASYYRKSDSSMQHSDLLSNDFKFHQDILNYRASVKRIIKEKFSVTAGTSVEQTLVHFTLYRDQKTSDNSYWTWLPFFNMNKSWKDQYNLTLAYRRSIRRPGINELNPAIDYGDPYNVRFGNTGLKASTAHNFDLVAGRTKQQFYINLGLGYNIVEDIFSQVRSLMPDGKTQVTWQNISGRHEYEISTWGGITVKKKWRTSLSGTYSYNAYSHFDKTVNRYRDGGSFTSNLSSTYTPNDTRNIVTSFTFNRIASAQGYARWNWSMNVGYQQKFFRKKLSITVNVIDPIRQQTRNFTWGPNFNLRSYNTNRTQNLRLNLGYNFTKTPVKKKPVLPVK